MRTEPAVADAGDEDDLDSLTATPLPAQESVMKAFGQRGFGFESADLANGQVDGTSRSLRFYQEIELNPAPQ